jgi:hypothetical protein
MREDHALARLARFAASRAPAARVPPLCFPLALVRAGLRRPALMGRPLWAAPAHVGRGRGGSTTIIRSRLEEQPNGRTRLNRVLVAAPPTAVVPGHRLGPVAIHMTAAQVRHALGAPRRATRAELVYGSFDVKLSGGRVVRISTTAKRYRTREGFGVGTRVERLQRLRGLVCNLETGGGDCDAPGIRFDFAHDRVTRVTVT